MEVGQLNKKIVFVIQARVQSTRLPKKVLMPLPIDSEENVLNCIVNQLNKSTFNSDIFIATSENNHDDAIEEFCIKNNINCFRGSEDDVLSRFIAINKNYDVCVRLTGDNPVLDIQQMDSVIQQHIQSKNDYTATKGLPLGMNFEIVNSSALLSLDTQNLSNEDKEHVTLYIKKSNLFNCSYIEHKESNKYEKLRLTIDYPLDYLTVSSIVSLGQKNNIFGLKLIDYVIESFPWILELNKDNYQKQQFTTLKEEYDAALPILDKFDFLKLKEFLKTNISNEV